MKAVNPFLVAAVRKEVPKDESKFPVHIYPFR